MNHFFRTHLQANAARQNCYCTIKILSNLMNVESDRGGEIPTEIPPKSIERKRKTTTLRLHYSHALQHAHSCGQRGRKNHSQNSYEKARAVEFSRRGQRLSVRLYSFSSLLSAFSILHIFFLYLYCPTILCHIMLDCCA